MYMHLKTNKVFEQVLFPVPLVYENLVDTFYDSLKVINAILWTGGYPDQHADMWRTPALKLDAIPVIIEQSLVDCASSLKNKSRMKQ
jgi:hypothetical protein